MCSACACVWRAWLLNEPREEGTDLEGALRRCYFSNLAGFPDLPAPALNTVLSHCKWISSRNKCKLHFLWWLVELNIWPVKKDMLLSPLFTWGDIVLLLTLFTGPFMCLHASVQSLLLYNQEQMCQNLPQRSPHNATFPQQGHNIAGSEIIGPTSGCN